MSSEIEQLYQLMMALHQQGRLPLSWRQIEMAYAQKYSQPLPKRINLLLANGARGEQTDGPLYLRMGKGVYDLMTATTVILNDLNRITSRQTRNLTEAIKAAQAGEIILVYPNSFPYQEELVFDKALHIKGKWDRQHQVIRSMTLNCLQLQSDHEVTLQNLTFKDSFDCPKKKQVLTLAQGQLKLIDCDFDFEAPLEIEVHAKASVKFANCQVKAKQITLKIHKEATVQLDHSDLCSRSLSGINLSLKGKLLIHNSQWGSL